MNAESAIIGAALAFAGAVLYAQEGVTPGNERAPHQVPQWFARMASPEQRPWDSPESFIVGDDSKTTVAGRPARSVPKYICKWEKGEGGSWIWHFCDM